MPNARILIVEDEGIVAADLARKLQRLGYTVAGKTGLGEKAIDQTHELRPQLVLMDIGLAGDVDGIEAADRIRQECDVPVVYLTAYSDRATIERAKITQPFGFILKPFEERELETHIEMALYKHQVEHKLRDSEQRWATTLASIGDAVIAADAEGRVTFMNAVAETLTGWTMCEAMQQPVAKVFHIISEATRKPVKDPVSKVLKHGAIVGLGNHTLLLRKDGTEVPIGDSGAPIVDAAGRIVGVVLVFRDITERRRAEEQLRESRQKYQALTEATSDFIWEMDAQGRFTYCSPQMQTLWGLDPANMIGRTPIEMLPEEIQAQGGQGFRELLQAARPFSGLESVSYDGRGRLIDLDISGVPFFDQDGGLLGFRGITRDVTQRKATEGALRETESRLRLMLDATGFGTFDYCPATGRIIWDDQMKRIWGIPLEQNLDFSEVLGRVHPDDQERIGHLFAEALGSHGSGHYAADYRIVWPDGSTHWTSARGLVQYQGEGENRRAIRVIGIEQDITERKQAEAALRESEQLLRAVTDNSPDAIYAKDRDSRWILANPAVLHIVGRTAEQALGKTDLELYDDPAIGRAILENDRQIMEEGRTQGFEEVADTADGRRTFLSVKAPRWDPQGNVVGLIGISRDITDVKRAEEALYQTKTQLEMLLQQAPVGFAYFDLGLRFLQINERLAEMNGLSVAAHLGRTVAEILPKLAPTVLEITGRVLATGEPVAGFEISGETPAQPGVARSWSENWYPLRNAEGTIIGFGALVTEITDRKRAEQALRQSEHRERERAEELAAVLGAVPTPVIITYEPKCTHLIGNRAANELLRLPSGGELSLTAPLERRPPHYKAVKEGRELKLHELPIRRAAKGEDVQDFEYTLVFDDGTTRELVAYARPLIDAQGNPRGAVHTLVDITERKKAEEQVKAALREKEIVLKELHHRVKNNLQVIASLVSLQADRARSPAISEVFQVVRERVRTMSLVHEILYHSDNLAEVPFDDYAARLLRYIWKVRAGAAASKIALRMEISPLTLTIDQSVPLGLILNELVTNALKHAFQSRETGEITVSLKRQTDGSICLTVRDNGIGLPAELDWRQTQSLGLRLVTLLAGQLNGSLDANTEPGKKTEFKLEFQPVFGRWERSQTRN